MTHSPPDSDLDAARAMVAARGLTPTAAGALSDIVKRLPIEALTPVKQLLKRFFSDEPWLPADDASLAEIVGPGTGTDHLALDADLTLTWGWEDGRFLLRVASVGPTGADSDRTVSDTDLGLTFESDVFPGVTPSPRTIRFTTPPLHSGPSRVYNSRADAERDPHAQRIFDGFASVTNMLIGPDFVAITIVHPDQWDSLLVPMLHAITDEFAGEAREQIGSALAGPGSPQGAGSSPAATRTPRRLERAWVELGALRGDRAADLDVILAASRDSEPARRQVAAALLADAPAEAAADAWARLLADESRSVRRSVVDAVVDADREALRPLLERALSDTDAWTRWKAVHGLAALGLGTSRAAVANCASDPDLRVRLEAARALA